MENPCTKCGSDYKRGIELKAKLERVLNEINMFRLFLEINTGMKIGTLYIEQISKIHLRLKDILK